MLPFLLIAAQDRSVFLEGIRPLRHCCGVASKISTERLILDEKTKLDLLRRIRVLPGGKDRPVTIPFALFADLLRAAMEGVVDEAWYTARYPDVAAAIKSGVFSSAEHHFAAVGLAEGRMPLPVAIDESSYLDRHKDVAKAIQSGKVSSATQHFYTSGFYEGRAYELARDADLGRK